MNKFVGYLGLFMSAFFVASGLYMAFSQFLTPPKDLFEQFGLGYLAENPAVFNYLVAALLVVYGFFRFLRSVKTIRESREQER